MHKLIAFVKTCVCMGVAWMGLSAYAVSPTTAAAEKPLPQGITLAAMKRLDHCLKNDGWSALVSFRSRTILGDETTLDGRVVGKRIMLLTAWTSDSLAPNAREKFVIDGTFKLDQSVGGTPPAMGIVSQTLVDVSRQAHALDWREGDRMAHPYFPLTEATNDGYLAAGLHFLAVGAKSDSILKSTLVGPFIPEESDDVAAATKLLLQPAANDVPAERLREWLAEKNPAVVMVALSRLQALDMASPEDYVRAIVSIRPSHSAEVVTEIRREKSDDASFMDKFASELRVRLAELKPDARNAIREASAPILKRDDDNPAVKLLLEIMNQK